jgi:hypothetical protein
LGLPASTIYTAGRRSGDSSAEGVRFNIWCGGGLDCGRFRRFFDELDNPQQIARLESRSESARRSDLDASSDQAVAWMSEVQFGHRFALIGIFEMQRGHSRVAASAEASFGAVSLFIARTTRKTANAMIRKSMIVLRKTP